MKFHDLQYSRYGFTNLLYCSPIREDRGGLFSPNITASRRGEEGLYQRNPFLWVIFVLLDPDLDPLTCLNPDPIRIRKTDRHRPWSSRRHPRGRCWRSRWAPWTAPRAWQTRPAIKYKTSLPKNSYANICKSLKCLSSTYEKFITVCKK